MTKTEPMTNYDHFRDLHRAGDPLVLVNAWWESLDFVLPETRPQAGWQVEIDTYDPVSQAGPATAERKAGDHITVGPRSVVVLKNPYSG